MSRKNNSEKDLILKSIVTPKVTKNIHKISNRTQPPKKEIDALYELTSRVTNTPTEVVKEIIKAHYKELRLWGEDPITNNAIMLPNFGRYELKRKPIDSIIKYAIPSLRERYEKEGNTEFLEVLDAKEKYFNRLLDNQQAYKNRYAARTVTRRDKGVRGLYGIPL